ncbi:hypothetical protein [Kineococcus rhizosphaerae]|uniref:Uncharacterized protein n=1 Tax=Kineococcus rhizosphaerae TaxID=559628 RepID=A0A2T0R187_9ACTN|nr:hypothetical protein [Kineococcus rhizosphaerae]PRY13026.1 hypothetical protein CLV37_109217 [Kineococcus rhizosphaerae]
MRLTGLERAVLEAAEQSHVLVEPESAEAVGAVYLRLNRDGFLDVEWWPGDPLPLLVAITGTGRTVLALQRDLG